MSIMMLISLTMMVHMVKDKDLINKTSLNE